MDSTRANTASRSRNRGRAERTKRSCSRKHSKRDEEEDHERKRSSGSGEVTRRAGHPEDERDAPSCVWLSLLREKSSRSAPPRTAGSRATAASTISAACWGPVSVRALIRCTLLPIRTPSRPPSMSARVHCRTTDSVFWRLIAFQTLATLALAFRVLAACALAPPAALVSPPKRPAVRTSSSRRSIPGRRRPDLGYIPWS